MDDDAPVWHQPVIGESLPRAALALPGLESLQLFTDARVLSPPISYLTGMSLTEVGPGTARFDMPITGWLVGPHGRSYLGVLAILADGPLGCAIHTVLPAGIGQLGEGLVAQASLSWRGSWPSTGPGASR